MVGVVRSSAQPRDAQLVGVTWANDLHELFVVEHVVVNGENLVANLKAWWG